MTKTISHGKLQVETDKLSLKWKSLSVFLVATVANSKVIRSIKNLFKRGTECILSENAFIEYIH